ncbi:uncharacterized protein LOC117107264 isoform X2 [Anneissia japonica]|uniref:uncharacterized protein LOC117107264 isoform X2 n=1 Tax=Anneissia japonica TaxID=1529436 RepID=UPI0014256ACF|nr:uncharacterized protein LOC117107264 isoform X2 [Anneissia japonica]
MLCTKEGGIFGVLKRHFSKILVIVAFLHLLLIARLNCVLNKPNHRLDFQELGLYSQSGFAVSPFFPFVNYSQYKDIIVCVVPTMFSVVGYFSTLMIVEMINNLESPDEKVPDDDVNNAYSPQPSTEERISADVTSTENRVQPIKSSLVMFIQTIRRSDIQMPLYRTILIATSITVIFITTGNFLWDRTMDIFSLPMIIVWIGVGDIVGRTIAVVSTDRLWIWNDRVSERKPILFIVPHCIIAAVPYICTIFISSPIVRKVALVGIIVPRIFLVLLLPPVVMEAINCNEMRAERVALVYIIFGFGSFWITPIRETLYDVTGSHTATWYILVLSTMASVEAVLLAAAVWARNVKSKSEKPYDELSEC